MKDMQEHDGGDGGQKHDDQQGDLGDGFFLNDPNPNHFESMNWEDEVMGAEDLLQVDDALMSYGDFPPLPDFPCISSSSSSSASSCSSSAPAHHVNLSHHHQHQHHAVTCSNNNNNNLNNSSSSSASSASSSASWAVVKPDHGEESVGNRQGYGLLSTDSMEIRRDEINRMDSADCMDVMEGLGEMDLLDTDDIWDPSSLFPYEDQDYDPQQVQNHEQQEQLLGERERGGQEDDGDEKEKNNKPPSEDLALVFLEWLKSNKESISAEDLRSIKLKRSTIECAAQKLGGGKEGMKQLLKLILEWVQNHHLQRKRIKEGQASSYQNYHQENPNPNPNPNTSDHLNYNSFTPESNPCYNPPISSTPWSIAHHPVPPPAVPYVSDPLMSGSPSSYPPPAMHGFIGDPSLFVPHFNQNPYSSSTDYMLESSQNWPPPPPPPPSHFSLSSHYTSYPDSHHHLAPSQPPPPLSRSFSNYQNQYPPCQVFQGNPGDGSLIRLGSSATKEARKKRMARQRRFFSHHQRHSQQQQHHHHHQTSTEQQTRLVNDNNCTATTQVNNQANWVYWASSPPPSTAVAVGSMSPMLVSDGQPPLSESPPMQTQNYQRQVNMERRHGCKPEKNLKFLLQKVLKQSDVGNLGRIVLPKKEAETYLPELEARDGISIAMEDIGTSRIWNMRYRFWPNNKSRMYLLENTGDFVRSNGLQEGDFIVIYSDIKGGKYMIRGVKVRQPGSKSEAKKSTKAHRNLHVNSPGCDGSSSSMMKQAAVA